MNGRLSHDEEHLAHSREQSRTSARDRDIAWDTGASHASESGRAMNRVNW
jgi:hypothetical protein